MADSFSQRATLTSALCLDGRGSPRIVIKPPNPIYQAGGAVLVPPPDRINIGPPGAGRRGSWLVATPSVAAMVVAAQGNRPAGYWPQRGQL